LLKAFARDSVVYMVPAVVSRGLAIILVPLYTRALSPADFGSLDLLVVFATLVKLTVALEVSQAVARFYAAEPGAGRRVAYASTSWWFTVLTYSLFALAALWQAESLADLVMGRGGMASAFRIGVLYIWASGLFFLIQNQLRWELRSVPYAVTSGIMTIVTAAGALVAIYALGLGLEGLLWGMAAGAAAGAAYGLSRLQGSYRWRFDVAALREMLAFSLPLVPASIAVFVNTFADRLMVNHLLSVDAVGVYGIGFRIASVVGLVMVGFQAALTPLVYTYYRERDTPAILARIFRVFVAFALLLSLGLVLFAHEILAFMAPPAYASGASVIALLVPSVLLAQMSIFTPGIVIARKTHLILAITVAAAAANIMLNWLLIPVLDIDGAALATLLANAGAFAAYLVWSQRLYPVPHRLLALGAAVAGVAALAALRQALLAEGAMRLVLDAGALVAAAVAVVVLGLVRPNEVRSGFAWARSRLGPPTARREGSRREGARREGAEREGAEREHAERERVEREHEGREHAERERAERERLR
jgi:O-antigen/teichoic acid export membrane protein